MLWRVAESVLRPEMSVKHRILTGLMLQGLSVHRAKCNEKDVFRAIMISIRLRAFVILCLQFHRTEKVVQLRSQSSVLRPQKWGDATFFQRMSSTASWHSTAAWHHFCRSMHKSMI